jgi:hypothetical protein
MPRIPPAVFDSVFYLYHSELAASEGREFGGSGFFVGMPSERFPDKLVHVHAVTNWHVAYKGGASVVRRMTPDGRAEIHKFLPDDWEFLAAYDIAALLMPRRVDVTYINTSAFLRQAESLSGGRATSQNAARLMRIASCHSLYENNISIGRLAFA